MGGKKKKKMQYSLINAIVRCAQGAGGGAMYMSSFWCSMGAVRIDFLEEVTRVIPFGGMGIRQAQGRRELEKDISGRISSKYK